MLTNELLNLSFSLLADFLDTDITTGQFIFVKIWFFPLVFS